MVLDTDLRVQKATLAFYETFLVSREETEGRLLYDLGNGQWNRPRLRELLGGALFRGEPFHDFEVEHDFPNIGLRTMRLNGRRIPRPDPQQRTLLLAIEDVTERREIAEIRYRRLFETAKDAIVVIDAETEIVQDVNAFFLGLTRMPRESFVGKTFARGRRVAGDFESQEHRFRNPAIGDHPPR
ncbi:MAG: PAS domain-containing protein [Ignavibacteriota bacterium]